MKGLSEKTHRKSTNNDIFEYHHLHTYCETQQLRMYSSSIKHQASGGKLGYLMAEPGCLGGTSPLPLPPVNKILLSLQISNKFEAILPYFSVISMTIVEKYKDRAYAQLVHNQASLLLVLVYFLASAYFSVHFCKLLLLLVYYILNSTTSPEIIFTKTVHQCPAVSLSALMFQIIDINTVSVSLLQYIYSTDNTD